MRIDFGLVLAIIIECILFIYYADTLFCRKRNNYVCYAIIGAGYAVHLVICIFGDVIVNTVVFYTINAACLLLCYHISVKSALFQSLTIYLLSTAGEWSVVCLPYLGIPLNPLQATPVQSFILTLLSKSMYLIGIMAAGQIFAKRQYEQKFASSGLIVVPIISTIIVVLILKSYVSSYIMSFICFLIIVINLLIFTINQWMIRKDIENAELKKQLQKENVDYEEYMLLKEKYNQMRSFRHDFKEHLSLLSSLITEDNDKAKNYIDAMFKQEDAVQYTQYSDNSILNILLSRKKTECSDENISFLIDPILARMSFLSDMDVVTLFSNLINNAVEGCRRSKEKKIFLSISTANGNFVVIKLENTSDIKPTVIDGHLRTHKDNEVLHGIGMGNIAKVVKKYSGDMNWSYDQTEKIFSVVIVLKNIITV